MARSPAKPGAKCWSLSLRRRAAYASSRRGRAPPGSQSSRRTSAELLRRRCQYAEALDHPRVVAILTAHRNIDAVLPVAPGLHLIWVTAGRSEEHTSELQSQSNLVCRLLLEKKNKKKKQNNTYTNNK